MTTVSFAQPDVTLVLDMDGVIRNATLSSAFAREGVEAWFGRAWTDTVAELGTDKVQSMLDDARDVGFSAFRQVTQCFPSGLELPIEYTTLRLGGPSGIVAIGKNLQAVSELQSRLIAAQHAMEQDYWKLREVETRYRLLFDVSNEAVLLLHAESLRIVEANPAAIRVLGLKPGREFLPEISPQEHEAFKAMLLRVRAQGRAPGSVLHLRSDNQPWMVRASLMSAEPGAVYLLQLSTIGTQVTQRPASTARADSTPLATLIERLPEGFVIVDADGVIRRANRAFVELAEVGTAEAVLGERLDRWLTLPGADASVLLANVRLHKTVRSFTTEFHGELGTHVEVDVSAAGDVDVNPNYACILMRDVGYRNRSPANDREASPFMNGHAVQVPALPNPAEGFVEISGKVSLKQLVQEATALVERHYVNSALDLADGNRTAAAGLLGLSRQSLYAKLNRYGLDHETAQGIDTPD